MGSYLNIDYLIEGDAYSVNNFAIGPNKNMFISYQIDSLGALALGFSGSVDYGGGRSDIYLEKRSPEGLLLWRTLLGGEGDDQLKFLHVSTSGIYIAGKTTSRMNISTSGVFQENFKETTNYDKPNAFFLKLEENGAKVWGTYFRSTTSSVVEEVITDMAIDTEGNLYIVGFTESAINIATTNAYDGSIGAAATIGFIQKFTSSGQREWGTYYGTDGAPSTTVVNNIAVDQDDNLVIAGNIILALPKIGYFLSSGTYNDHQNSNALEIYIAKFDATGTRLWGLVFGGEYLDYAISLKTDTNNNIVILGGTYSLTDIASPGGYQEVLGSSDPVNEMNDAYLAKFSPEGQRLWSTYYGGHFRDSYTAGGAGLLSVSKQNISMDEHDNIYVVGHTNSAHQIATNGTYQDSLNGLDQYDAYIAKFTATGERVWGSYYGGKANDFSDGVLYAGEGQFYIYGRTASAIGVSSGEAWFSVSKSNETALFLAKFKPNPLHVESPKERDVFSVYPNPSHGIMTVSSKIDTWLTIKLFDMQGRLVFQDKVLSNHAFRLKNSLKSGFYLVSIHAKGVRETHGLLMK